MTEAEVKRISDEAARKAVREMLIAMGADPNDPIELQKDFAFLRSWRESSSRVKLHVVLTAVGVLIVAGLGLIWAAAKGA